MVISGVGCQVLRWDGTFRGGGGILVGIVYFKCVKLFKYTYHCPWKVDWCPGWYTYKWIGVQDGIPTSLNPFILQK